MEQRSVATQTTRPEPEAHRTTSTYRWMRHFFTEGVSPETRPLIGLERRAAWLGLALILQALNEIDRNWYLSFVPQLLPYGGLIPFFLIGGSFIAMWLGFRPTTMKQQHQEAQKHLRTWQRVMLILALLTTMAGCIELGRTVWMCFLPPQYSNDGTTLDTNAAYLLLQGRNPYTDSSLLQIARRYPIQPYWTTPLRVGQFANDTTYPNPVEMRNVLDTDLKAGKTPEFETKVSYPSLSFLTLLPFVWLNFYNVLPFYFACYLLLVFLGWKFARPELRPWVLVFSLTNVSMWSSVVGGNLDIFSILLVVMVWLLRDRTWGSSIFLGLALASKQTAWFFVPFYLIMVYRQYGSKEVVRRLLIGGGVALAINLPFIVWNPQAWLAGILAPIADPMFPEGVGLVGLSTTPLVSLFPSIVYNALEAIAMLLCLLWYWRLCKERPEAVMLLAVLPLFFAWRSLPSYFYCSAFPMFIVMAAKVRTSGDNMARKLFGEKAHIPLEHDTPAVAPLGVRAAFQHSRS